MSKINKSILSISIPIIFVCFVLYTIPIPDIFSFDPDEGLELMKAFLYSQGFSLYTEIWNDQPPLFTILLSIWFNLFGYSVFAARILVLLLSAVLVWSFYNVMRYFIGILPALVGTFLLIFSSNFIKLSVSVMVGIPFLSLTMLSIYLLIIYHEKRSKISLILSGCLFAFSLQTKFLAIVIIPAIILLIAYFKVEPNRIKPSLKKLAIDIIYWLTTIGVLFLILSVIFNSINYEQLWQSHDIGSNERYGKNYNSDLIMYQVIGNRRVFSLLACLGIFTVFAKRRWEGLIPLGWLGTALVFMLNHKPIWYHHYLVIFIPMAWLSAYAFILVVDLCQRNNWYTNFKLRKINKLIVPGLAVFLLINFIYKIPSQIPNFKDKPRDLRFESVELLLKNKESTQWVFTDSPIIAFYAGLPVPPKVAVLSRKRFLSNNITLDDIQSVIQTYRPEQIVFARWKETLTSHQGIKAYLDKNYRKIYPRNFEDKKAAFEQYVLN
jgi:4-amino-4-deoxy-L-arabinose transferase-like glycosyltransferase